mmetsp:Transcript_92983/g.201092  ORF Transcript_92983/g.201092 Transcript_92983/m.201092 type:complete len:218 (+) Transcript_92983:545-1198(+)
MNPPAARVLRVCGLRTVASVLLCGLGPLLFLAVVELYRRGGQGAGETLDGTCAGRVALEGKLLHQLARPVDVRVLAGDGRVSLRPPAPHGLAHDHAGFELPQRLARWMQTRLVPQAAVVLTAVAEAGGDEGAVPWPRQDAGVQQSLMEVRHVARDVCHLAPLARLREGTVSALVDARVPPLGAGAAPSVVPLERAVARFGRELAGQLPRVHRRVQDE